MRTSVNEYEYVHFGLLTQKSYAEEWTPIGADRVWKKSFPAEIPSPLQYTSIAASPETLARRNRFFKAAHHAKASILSAKQEPRQGWRLAVAFLMQYGCKRAALGQIPPFIKPP